MASASAGGGALASADAAPCGRLWTALHFAAYNGHADAMCALILAGATVDIKDKEGCGSRFWAGACEPKGNAPADAACSYTAKDFAKDRDISAEYANAVKRVRLPAHAGATAGAMPCAL